MEAARLLSKVRTIAAFAYRKSRGLPIIYPKPDYKYTANFLHMMFSLPYQDYELKPEMVKALDLIFLLHADHEQNCSTATVRMVASSRANLFASAAAGVCALWGPLHGGANQAVLEMLEEIHRAGDDGSQVHRGGQGQEQRQAADGLRPPGLQELRSARQDHQEGLRRGAGQAARQAIRCSTSPSTSRRRRSAIPISSSASCIRTWTSTAASSCAPSAFRWRCSP